MYPRLTLILLLFLPCAVSFPAQPSSNVFHPRYIHQTFLQLKARRIRHATVHLASTLFTNAQLQVSSRAGLAFEPCAAPDDCQGERTCVQLAGSTSGEVELTDCENGVCFCSDMEGCSSTDDCLMGETCAAGGTCVSNAFVPGATQLDEADPTLGLNLDPCQSIADCQNPRNCVQFVEGEFGQCTGANCFCVRPDPSCTSVSECAEGESCTQREGTNNAICISETAIINGDATDEEIDEIPDGAAVMPPMPEMLPTAPATNGTEETEAPPTPATPTPATPTPATPDSTDMMPTPAPGASGSPAPVVPVPPEDADTPTTSEAPEAPEDTTTIPPVPLPEVSAPEEDDGSTVEPEQADREPMVVLPGGDGATVSPDTDEAEEVVPADTDPEAPALTDGDGGEILPTPDDDLIDPVISSTPSAVIEDGADEEETSVTPDPEDVICIGEHHLVHMSRDELLYSSNRVARVLCDENNSCATPGHIVMFHGKPMMMSNYCSKATCAPRIMKVNSPRYRRAARVGSHTDGLSFTAFAARYETKAEEHLLRTFVRMGL